MRFLILVLFTIASMLCHAQVTGTFKQVRLVNNTDSTGLGSITGIIRYDPSTGKYRFYNALTSTWFSYEVNANSFWKVAGSTTVTNPTIIGNPFFQGNTLIANSGSTITSNVRLDVKGSNTGSSTYSYYGRNSSDVRTFALRDDGALIIGSNQNKLISSSADGTSVSNSGNGFLVLTDAANLSGIPSFNIRSGSITNASANRVVSGIGGFSFAPSSGTGNFTALEIWPTHNTTGSYSGILRGLYINPTNTSLTGATHIAFENTSGQIRFGGVTQDDTKTRIASLDNSTGQLFWRDVSSIPGTFSGSLASTQVAFGSGANAITGESGFTYNSTTDELTVGNILTNMLRSSGVNNSSALLVEDDAGNDIIHAFELGGLTYADVTGSGNFIANFAGTAVITSATTTISGTNLNLGGAINVQTLPSTDNTNTDILTRDGSGNLEIRTASSLTSTPGGSNTQIQYNNSGSFGAEAGFTYDQSVDLFTVSTVEVDAGEISRVNKAADIDIASGSNTRFLDSDNTNQRVIFVSPYVSSGTYSEISATKASAIAADDFTIRAGDGFTSGTANIAAGDNLVLSSGGGAASSNGDGGNITLTLGNPSGSGVRGNVIVPNLPTSDPSVSNSIWLNEQILVQGSQKFYEGSATLDFPSTSASSSNDLTITVTGATTGDVVSLGAPAPPTGASIYTAYVTSSNTVTVRFSNLSTGASADPASATFKVTVIKQ